MFRATKIKVILNPSDTMFIQKWFKMPVLANDNFDRIHNRKLPTTFLATEHWRNLSCCLDDFSSLKHSRLLWKYKGGNESEFTHRISSPVGKNSQQRYLLSVFSHLGWSGRGRLDLVTYMLLSHTTRLHSHLLSGKVSVFSSIFSHRFTTCGYISMRDGAGVTRFQRDSRWHE